MYIPIDFVDSAFRFKAVSLLLGGISDIKVGCCQLNKKLLQEVILMKSFTSNEHAFEKLDVFSPFLEHNMRSRQYSFCLFLKPYLDVQCLLFLTFLRTAIITESKSMHPRCREISLSKRYSSCDHTGTTCFECCNTPRLRKFEEY